MLLTYLPKNSATSLRLEILELIYADQTTFFGHTLKTLTQPNFGVKGNDNLQYDRI